MTALDDIFPGYSPFLRLARSVPPGGQVLVKTFACNEVQVRIQHGIAALLRNDIHKETRHSAKRGKGSLVLCRKSQTFPETGEVVELPRERTFTRHARHMLRECGAVLEQRYSKQVAVITLTLPGSTKEAVREFATYDKQIKNAFLQNVRKLFAQMFPCGKHRLDYCLVSELQERGAIHFHLAIGLPSEHFGRALSILYRRWWSKLIRWYSRVSGVNLAYSVKDGDLRFKVSRWFLECARVKKSVANYLAKYVSKAKSKQMLPEIDCPSRWWQVSRSMRASALGARSVETLQVESWERARTIVENVARVLLDNGVKFERMVNKFTGEPLGIVFFPEKEVQWWHYEWCRMLVSKWKDVTPITKEQIWENLDCPRLKPCGKKRRASRRARSFAHQNCRIFGKLSIGTWKRVAECKNKPLKAEI